MKLLFKTALAAAIACSPLACSKSAPAPESKATPPPLPADVQKVAAVVVPQDADASADPGAGRLALTGEFVALVHSDLVPRTAGRVARVFVDEGEAVRKGQPLLQLETEYLKIDLARAEADLRRAEAAAQDAASDLERKRGLVQKGSVSQATFDHSQSGAAQAEAARQAAAASLDLARQHLADALLRSPVDGVVAEKRTDVGERLAEGTVAFVVEQTAPLDLRLRVPERYLGSVARGLPVRATIEAYPGKTFLGRVSLVGGSLDTQTRTFLVQAQFPNRDGRLRPGLFARVELDLSREADRAEAR